MIPTYNCARFLPQTLASVLRQDPGARSMQIEVVDDHSADNPAAAVASAGAGRVGFFQQRANVGHIENFATCLRRSRGQLVHLLHGDDYVCDGFYERMERAFAQQPDIGAAFCRQAFIDQHGRAQGVSDLEQPESGILQNWLERLASEQRIMTPSIVVRRDVYEALGGFDRRLVCSEDWEMWVRIAASYPIWYETEPLAVYRMHAASNTGRHIRSAKDIRYTRKAIEIFKGYLPPAVADRVTRTARQVYAISALDMAYAMFQRRDAVATLAQLREALLLSCSRRVLRHLTRLVVRAGKARSRRGSTHSRQGA
jgi:glycosyltransferase involved in cell wall biosynthesis